MCLGQKKKNIYIYIIFFFLREFFFKRGDILFNKLTAANPRGVLWSVRDSGVLTCRENPDKKITESLITTECCGYRLL